MVDARTTAEPLRVAVIGAGPAGFYALAALGNAEVQVEVDMFDRLPAPFGLVRYGVSPDHPKDKSVTRAYARSAQIPGFRFYGNVQYGRDLSLEDLRAHYHQVIFTTGAQDERHLGVVGEDLDGCHGAAEFVAWYNGHPDFVDRRFDLSRENVVIVGIGNVALDVARMLCHSPEQLSRTDIADYALEALRHSRVRNITVLGRRGPVQAAFTPATIREFGDLPGADVTVPAEEAVVDEYSAQALAAAPDKNVDKNIAYVQQFAASPPTGRKRLITLRFLISPTELIGSNGRLEAVKLAKSEAYRADDGSIRARATGIEETIAAGLLFRAVGYRGVGLPGIPFDDERGVLPNVAGRVIDAAGDPVPGIYAAGWIKRGPTGVIGTNKPCARETVAHMFQDLSQGVHLNPGSTDPAVIDRLVHERVPGVISYADWQLIDQLELSRGEASDRPRIKFTGLDDILAALGRA